MIKINFLFLTFFLFLIVLITNNIIVFTPWSQIEYIHDVITNKDKLFSDIEEKFHIFRYIIIFPAYFISNILKIEITKTYSIYVISALLSTSIIWDRICQYKKTNKIETFIKSIIPLLLAFIINGRFAFSILGISSLVLGNLFRRESKNKHYFLDIFGLILIIVSSGSLIVGFFLFTLSNFQDIKKFIRYIIFELFLKSNVDTKNYFLVPISIVYSFLFINLIVYINKIINFYGGYNLKTFSGLFNHGFGILIVDNVNFNSCNFYLKENFFCEIFGFFSMHNILGLILIVIFLLSMYFYFKIFKTKEFDIIVKLLIFITSFAGLFGLFGFLSVLAIIPLINFKEIANFNNELLGKKI